MKTFHKACETIFKIAIINFLLFFVIAVLIGGDALNGKEELGRYYLANHGKYTEVSYWVFMYSTLHAKSLFITHPLAIILGWIYHFTGGANKPPPTIAVEKRQTDLGTIKRISHSTTLSLWKTADLWNELIWWVFDAWRKPAVEFFSRLNQEECINQLRLASETPPHNLRKENLVGYFSGKRFYIRKWVYLPLVRDGGIHLVVSGKLSPTPQGTYVRAWHRISTSGILFLSTWFGLAASGLTMYGLYMRPYEYLQNFYTENLFYSVIGTIGLVVFIIVTLLAISISTSIGKNKNQDLLVLIRDTLKSPSRKSNLLNIHERKLE